MQSYSRILSQKGTTADNFNNKNEYTIIEAPNKILSKEVLFMPKEY